VGVSCLSAKDPQDWPCVLLRLPANWSVVILEKIEPASERRKFYIFFLVDIFSKEHRVIFFEKKREICCKLREKFNRAKLEIKFKKRENL
jgi:hypothetical protein